MTTYVLAMGKGGVAKTTSAAELVAYLAAKGRKVLAIDLDQQGNLSTRLGLTPDTAVTGTAADVLTGRVELADSAIDCPTIEGAWVTAGTHELADVADAPPPDLVTCLRDELPRIAGRWDDVVIDTPPAIGGLTLAGLAAAQVVIAPVATATEAYDQVGRLRDVIAAKIAPRIRRGAHIDWIVPCIYDARRRQDRDVLEALREDWGSQVTNPIREAVAVRDAYTAGLTISAYDPTSRPAADYAQALATITKGEMK